MDCIVPLNCIALLYMLGCTIGCWPHPLGRGRGILSNSEYGDRYFPFEISALVYQFLGFQDFLNDYVFHLYVLQNASYEESIYNLVVNCSKNH